MRIIYLIAALLFICSCKVSNGSGAADNNIIAHRGAWAQNGHPQNSIGAIKDAVRFNYAGSEFDIRITADDSLIIHHDSRYMRMNIEQTSYDSLIRFPLSNGDRLPTLREYLTAGLENNQVTKLICEIKPPQDKKRGIIMAEKVVDLVQQMNAQDKVIYISFGFEILKKIEAIDPSAHTQYLDGSVSPERLKKIGIDGIAYHHSVFKKNPEWIQSAKDNGITLNAWTVNKVEDMDFFLSHDFDYITTDEPTLVEDKIRAIKGKE